MFNSSHTNVTINDTSSPQALILGAVAAGLGSLSVIVLAAKAAFAKYLVRKLASSCSGRAEPSFLSEMVVVAQAEANKILTRVEVEVESETHTQTQTQTVDADADSHPNLEEDAVPVLGGGHPLPTLPESPSDTDTDTHTHTYIQIDKAHVEAVQKMLQLMQKPHIIVDQI